MQYLWIRCLAQWALRMKVFGQMYRVLGMPPLVPERPAPWADDVQSNPNKRRITDSDDVSVDGTFPSIPTFLPGLELTGGLGG